MKVYLEKMNSWKMDPYFRILIQIIFLTQDVYGV